MHTKSSDANSSTSRGRLSSCSSLRYADDTDTEPGVESPVDGPTPRAASAGHNPLTCTTSSTRPVTPANVTSTSTTTSGSNSNIGKALRSALPFSSAGAIFRSRKSTGSSKDKIATSTTNSSNSSIHTATRAATPILSSNQTQTMRSDSRCSQYSRDSPIESSESKRLRKTTTVSTNDSPTRPVVITSIDVHSPSASIVNNRTSDRHSLSLCRADLQVKESSSSTPTESRFHRTHRTPAQLRTSFTFDVRNYQVGGGGGRTAYLDLNWDQSRPSLLSFEDDHDSQLNLELDRRSRTKQRRKLVMQLQTASNQRIEQTRCVLALRRRARMKRSGKLSADCLLDKAYHGLTKRLLAETINWNFNSFTLDTLSGGHSLSAMLMHFFVKYDFIRIYRLDVTNVWKCFRMSFCF